MEDPYIGDIMICSFNYAPSGWAPCEGQLVRINQNPQLFSVIGTTYGGDGVNTFALPDLRGRAPLGMGAGFNPGARGGEENHTLTTEELPAHRHPAMGTNFDPNQPSPAGNYWATLPSKAYSAAPPNGAFNNAANGSTGSGQAHENMPPFLTLKFVIAVRGILPPRS